MKIEIRRIMELDEDEIVTGEIIFQSNYPDHCYVYLNKAEVCVKMVYIEVTQFYLYNIMLEEGKVALVRFGFSNIGLIHGHVPDVDIYICGSEEESVELLISRIVSNDLRIDKSSPEAEKIKETLHKKLPFCLQKKA